MGTHLIALSESYPMNTNMTGFKCFSKILFMRFPVVWIYDTYDNNFGIENDFTRL